MVYSVQQIKYEILAYIKEFGGDFSDWYVGVADDPKRLLVETHGIDEEVDPWLWKQALTYTAARNVQAYFLDRLRTDGVPAGPPDENFDCVYLYKKAPHTSP
ncbi:MAG: hypothetical protein CMM50_16905 [Rhodospirillaceae bacterium]|nr:hypothetical protein [Rhodospirillaceae bacterium]|tara:strand:- start:729 stop:1034 length:306 start_codon:yes stop_codon:yes gene_type:complete